MTGPLVRPTAAAAALLGLASPLIIVNLSSSLGTPFAIVSKYLGREKGGERGGVRPRNRARRAQDEPQV